MLLFKYFQLLPHLIINGDNDSDNKHQFSGFSLASLYRSVNSLESPCLLVIREMHNMVIMIRMVMMMMALLSLFIRLIIFFIRMCLAACYHTAQ